MAQQSIISFIIVAISVAVIANPTALYVIYRLITAITKTKKRLYIFLSLGVDIMLMVISMGIFAMIQPGGMAGTLIIAIIYGFFTIYIIIPAYFITWKYKPR